MDYSLDVRLLKSYEKLMRYSVSLLFYCRTIVYYQYHKGFLACRGGMLGLGFFMLLFLFWGGWFFPPLVVIWLRLVPFFLVVLRLFLCFLVYVLVLLVCLLFYIQYSLHLPHLLLFDFLVQFLCLLVLSYRLGL